MGSCCCCLVTHPCNNSFKGFFWYGSDCLGCCGPYSEFVYGWDETKPNGAKFAAVAGFLVFCMHESIARKGTTVRGIIPDNVGVTEEMFRDACRGFRDADTRMERGPTGPFIFEFRDRVSSDRIDIELIDPDRFLVSHGVYDRPRTGRVAPIAFKKRFGTDIPREFVGSIRISGPKPNVGDGLPDVTTSTSA